MGESRSGDAERPCATAAGVRSRDRGRLPGVRAPLRRGVTAVPPRSPGTFRELGCIMSPIDSRDNGVPSRVITLKSWHHHKAADFARCLSRDGDPVHLVLELAPPPHVALPGNPPLHPPWTGASPQAAQGGNGSVGGPEASAPGSAPASLQTERSVGTRAIPTWPGPGGEEADQRVGLGPGSRAMGWASCADSRSVAATP